MSGINDKLHFLLMRTNEATRFLSFFFGVVVLNSTVALPWNIYWHDWKLFSSVTAKIFDMMGNAMGGDYFVADVVENILGLKYIFIVKSIFDTL